MLVLPTVVILSAAGSMTAHGEPLECFGKKPTLIARPGKITNGTNRADVIVGTGGADEIRGRGGNDLICARGGRDTIAGGPGRDRIDAGGRVDHITGDSGDDTLDGGPGDDRIDGGPGRDILRGGSGNDTVDSRDGVAERPDGGLGSRDLAIVDALDTPTRFESVRSPADSRAFNGRVRSMGDLDQPIPAPEKLIAEVEGPKADGDFVCSVASYTAAPGYDEMSLMDPASDVIYPGSIIYGDTITTGEYVPLVADRAPLSLSVSLENISGSPARTVDDPKLSTVREAINSILSGQVTGATRARINYEVQEVHSEDQLALSLGANYKNAVVKVAGSFDFAKTNVTSRVVAKFQQVYYTIDIDIPRSPADMFRTLPNATALGSASPMYVSTVTYGRQILFTAESNYSKTEVAAALQASFKSAGQAGSVGVGLRNTRVLNNSTIRAFVLGGSGRDAAAAVVSGVDGLKELIGKGGDYSKESPGAPLSYKLRYLKNNSVAKIVLASDYKIRQCNRVKYHYTVTMKKVHWDNSGDGGATVEAYGWFGFRVGSAPESLRIKLWDHEKQNQYVSITEGGDWPSSGTIGEEAVTIEKSADGSLPDSLLIEGHLYEYDSGTNPDDDLRYQARKILRSTIDSEGVDASLDFGGDGNTAQVSYSILPSD